MILPVSLLFILSPLSPSSSSCSSLKTESEDGLDSAERDLTDAPEGDVDKSKEILDKTKSTPEAVKDAKN